MRTQFSPARVVLILVVTLVATTLSPGVGAKETDNSLDVVLNDPMANDTVVKTQAERDALTNLEAGKRTQAREQADAILKDGPSLVATYVRASIYYYEGFFPRALFLMRKSRDMLTDSFGLPPDDPDARRWHRRLLIEEASILGDMDRRQDQLEMLQYYDEYYKPSREVFQIWPLIKLHRFDEAREIGERLTKSDDYWTRLRAYNGLIAMADEMGDRSGTLSRSRDAWLKTQEKSCVIGLNGAMSEMQNLLYRETEALIKKAKTAEYQDCSDHPYVVLTRLYLLMGEFLSLIHISEPTRPY